MTMHTHGFGFPDARENLADLHYSQAKTDQMFRERRIERSIQRRFDRCCHR